MHEKLKLQPNDRVAIIGAGPAGSLFAYILLKQARQADTKLHVTLYDPRDFTKSGPAGCNGCVGVINNSLWHSLQRVGIDLEQLEEIVQSHLSGYLWYTSAGSLQVDLPNATHPIRTVFRGGGPRFGRLKDNASFDGYLLRLAIAQGARHEQVRVTAVELPSTAQPHDLVRLTLEKANRQWQIEAHLLVGAFGLNPNLMKHFKNLGIGYQPPQTVQAAQVELTRRPGATRQACDDYIRVYNISGSRVRQLVLTPKGQYATLTLLASHDLQIENIYDIKNSSQVQSILESGWDWPEQFCRCMPRLEKHSGKHFYADRVVLVGDAACCRYYKNGLESALTSAKLAAETALFYGISRRDFHWAYYSAVRQQIIRDNYFGRFLLGAHSFISSHPILMRLALQTRSEVTRPHVRQHYDEILWNMLSGDRSYRHIFCQILNPHLVLDTCFSMLHVLCRDIIGRVGVTLGRHNTRIMLSQQPGSAPLSTRTDQSPPTTQADTNPVRPGCRISIIGGGPAGTTCAISLLQMAQRKNIDLDITIHEPKDFATSAATWHPSDTPSFDARINQCVGVLSPPIRELLTEKLHIPFPDHLVQKHITGYVLHGPRQSIMLEELKGSSYALRRITFDDYMMRQAIDSGAKLNLAALTRIERHDGAFTVTTTNGPCAADLVVGAFGVDPTAAECFAQCFGYRRPEYMQTIVTKRHPSPEFLSRFGLRIHVFLPRLRDVEFGAITPKFNHISINIAGKHVDDDTMNQFLALPEVFRLLPKKYDEKGSDIFYSGCFPTSPAANFFADNMVVIGDASGMIRPFKGKGVNSAILGALAAAQVIMHRGPSAQNFHDHYVTAFREITDDIHYARAARFMVNFIAKRGAVDALITLAKDAPKIQHALTGALSGAEPYKKIIMDIIHDHTLWHRWPEMLNNLRRTRASQNHSASHEATS